MKRDVIGVGGASCGVDNSVHAARRHPEVKSLVLLAGSTDLNGRKFLRASPHLPILFGRAGNDQYPTSVKTIQWLYTLDPNPGKRLVRYPDGGHGAEIFKAHPELERVITDWYLTTLVETPGRAPTARPVAMAEGYEHLPAGDIKGAIEILKLNAEANPRSANAHDSLADAYLAGGQKDLARQNAQRALELLPGDASVQDEKLRAGIRQSAEDKLKQLGAAPR